MTIHLGYGGVVEIARDSANQRLLFTIGAEDINVAERRFSFDFDYRLIQTGDRLKIETVDNSTLELVANHPHPDTLAYVHVDAAGGIRLYHDFFDALAGSKSNAIELMQPSKAQQVELDLDVNGYRCLAQVSEYNISTNRAQIDITQLGDEFKQNYANGLISGQGSLTCFWDYKHRVCDPHVPQVSELPQYMAELVLRTEIGSSFFGKFILHRPGPDEGNEDYVYYEARCVVTNCVMAVNPTEPIETKIDFVTTGEFVLKSGKMDSYLLQEGLDATEREHIEGCYKLNPGQGGAVMVTPCNFDESDPDYQVYCSIRNQNDVNEIVNVVATPNANGPTVTKYEVEVRLTNDTTTTIETFLDNNSKFFLRSSVGYCVASTTGEKAKVLQEDTSGILLE